MAIASTDIQIRLSGGATNSSAAASLGGAESTTAVPANRFGTRTAAEGAAGVVLYRCVYVHNANASLTLTSPTVSVGSDTPDAQSTIALGVGTSAVNGTEQTIANETTAPTGVTFGAGPLSLPDIPAGQHMAIWERLTLASGMPAVTNDPYSLHVAGSTAA